MREKAAAGHLAAFATILIWGTTFISTKVLLRDFAPVEILFIRFLVGYAALWCACPHRLRLRRPGQAGYFAAAGLCGVTLYYLLENVALVHTLAANVGVIISIAPFFTAIFSWLFAGGGRPGGRFLAGFALAMAGICLLGFGGGAVQVFPLGDLLAVLAAITWAAYALITQKIGSFGYSTLLATRCTFFFGLLFMLPALGAQGFHPALPLALQAGNLLNLLFLGLGASALCFVSWNFAVRALGPVKTSVYIYMVPVVTVATSAAVLGERVSGAAVAGIVLVLAGLFLSGDRKQGRD